jgi:phosphoribosylglycinamide formyltransferase-1
MSADLLRVAVLASGSGTNLQSLLDRCQSGSLPATVVVVISNNRDAYALERARRASVLAVHWSEKKAGSVEAFADGLLGILQRADTDLVVLAGYMKLVPMRVVEAFQGRMLNIHPALLPKFGGQGFYGMRVHEAVLAAGETESGATVHFVDAEYDRGPSFLQRTVPVMPDDTPETLRARVLAVEHELLPDAIAKFAAEYRRVSDGHAPLNTPKH